jgi:hypothetical protein
MDTSTQDLARIAAVGIGATAAMDLWLLLLKRLGMPSLNIAFIGRWAGHLVRGRWKHDPIAKSPPVPGEAALGWLVHYAVGIAFAALLAAIAGTSWLRAPSIIPALAIGVATTAAPLLVMQPSMGAGIASSRTPTPLKNCLRSFMNHTVFGAGLYVTAVLLSLIAP